MTSTVIGKVKDAKNKFPIIAEYKGSKLIVLFTSDNAGIVLSDDVYAHPSPVGTVSHDWVDCHNDQWRILDEVTINFKS